jgi:penicillin-binding protein 1C
LSLAQAALLAGLPQSPNRLRPDRHPAAALARRHHVLEAMRETGAISEGEFATADAEPLDARWLALPQRGTKKAYGALPALAQVAAGQRGGVVRTTINARVQQAAYALAKTQMEKLAANHVDSAAVVVVDVPTGNVLASVSISGRAGEVDLARRARSTGSLLKPFLYAAAFRDGILSPGDTLLDSPKVWSGYVPANFDKDFRGALPASEALAQSRNIPAMTVLSKVGVDEALAAMRAAGIETPGRSHRDYGLALAIGGAEATPLEMAEAYATLARGGERRAATLVAGGSGEGRRAFSAEVAEETLACLADERRTLAVEGAAGAAARGAAWKTGTSSDLRDAWCAAVTPRVAVVVWVGNADGGGSAALVGLDAAAPLALQVVGAIDTAPPSQPWVLAKAAAKKVAVAPVNGSPLAIVSPGPNADIFPIEGGSGQIVLQGSGGAGETRWWFANNALVGTGRPGERVVWKPGPGAYVVRLVDASGRAATVRVRVH